MRTPVFGSRRRLLADSLERIAAPDTVPAPPARRRLAGRYEIVFGGGLVVCIVLVAVLAPVLAPYSPTSLVGPQAAGPLTGGHLLGTDELGRDLLSRLIWGTRPSLLTGIVPTALALLLGGTLGLLAGYLGGIVDTLVMRVLDVLLAFPTVLLALAIAASLGPSLRSVVIAMTVVGIPAYARLIRATVLATRHELYLEAARMVGVRTPRVLAVHVLPNVVSPVVVYATVETGRNVLLAAGLSFLGLGVQPPLAEWGAMLNAGRPFMSFAPHVATIPGIAIFLLTVGFNLAGDGLRDLLDPKTRRRAR